MLSPSKSHGISKLTVSFVTVLTFVHFGSEAGRLLKVTSRFSPALVGISVKVGLADTAKDSDRALARILQCILEKCYRGMVASIE